MGLEDQVGEALEAPEALEGGVQFLLVVLEALEGGVHFLLEVLEALELEALEVGVQFLLEGLEARVVLVLGGLDLVASSGHASTCSVAAAYSKIAVARSSDPQAQAAQRRPSEFWQHANRQTYPPRQIMHWGYSY
ncbi:uncharacterized protein [Lolium perenne]|uniref:uncharacterized protein n=1 Tax=Lolium perenne TaxID=4522 RepID=UPI0021F59A35|nr:uncharacterized protein LOC127338853 [Lolium perenne]